MTHANMQPDENPERALAEAWALGESYLLVRPDRPDTWKRIYQAITHAAQDEGEPIGHLEGRPVYVCDSWPYEPNGA